MSLRLVVACDAPGCAARFESDPFAWGKGLDRCVGALARAGWTVGDEGQIFCPDHLLFEPPLVPGRHNILTADRLMRVFAPNARVRASVRIDYITEDAAVDEGALGTALRAHSRLNAMTIVQWDGLADPMATLNDLIDPV